MVLVRCAGMVAQPLRENLDGRQAGHWTDADHAEYFKLQLILDGPPGTPRAGVQYYHRVEPTDDIPGYREGDSVLGRRHGWGRFSATTMPGS